jgi:hypothetical protein
MEVLFFSYLQELIKIKDLQIKMFFELYKF